MYRKPLPSLLWLAGPATTLAQAAVRCPADLRFAGRILAQPCGTLVSLLRDKEKANGHMHWHHLNALHRPSPPPRRTPPGTIKRWHHKRGAMTHGSKSHREHGSIGSATTPSRVFPGLKMAGQMGNVRATVKNQTLLKVGGCSCIMYLVGIAVLGTC